MRNSSFLSVFKEAEEDVHDITVSIEVVHENKKLFERRFYKLMSNQNPLTH